MKKIISKLIPAVMILFCLSAASAAGKDKISLQTKVASVDVHGNANLAVKGITFSARGFSVSDIVNVTVGSYKCSAPIVQNYSDVATGEVLLRVKGSEVSLAVNMGSFAKLSGAKEGTPVTITMRERYGYLTAYHVRMLKKSDNREEFASDSVFANFREITAGNIAKGRLYRTSSPIIEDVRAPYAAKLLEEANVAAVINLHHTQENAAEFVEKVPFYKALSDEGKVIYLDMGVSFSDDSLAKLKQGLLFIANNKLPSYAIHGKEGKNRTGYVSALLEALCGASLKEITDDYMKSYENYYNVKAGSSQYNELAKSVQYMFMNMNGGKAVNDKNLSSVVEKFVTVDMGLTQEELAAIRENLQ